MVQEEERRCEVWRGEIRPHHTQGLLLMGEVWYSEVGRAPCQNLLFTERSRHGTLL